MFSLRPVVQILFFSIALLSSLAFAQSRPAAGGNTVVGTWYLALDAEPFGLPPGTNLPGLAQFHSDRTMTLVDAGDLGAAPFPTRDTAQLGNWTRHRGQVQTRTLFLQIDGETGQALGWNRVELSLSMPHGNVMEGHADVYFLACDQEAPFPVFFCSNPVESLSDFELVPPDNIPITLTRIPSP